MRIVILFVALALEILSSCQAQVTRHRDPMSTTQSPDIRGIYVVSYSLPARKSDSAAVVAALPVPGVDGVVLTIGWRILEPGMGKFDWAVLDRWMNIAINAGKKVELVIPSYLTPIWLFQSLPGGAGITPLSFTFTRKPSDTTCTSDTLAAPWDTAFLAQWDLMLDSVSSHLKNVGAYDAVVLLRLTGINMDTGELHLPGKVSPNAQCGANNVDEWLGVGYRPSRLLTGWDAITSSFKKHFPDKTFSVAIIASTNPFPPIAEDGSVYKDPIPNQNFPLLTLANARFPGHFVIQNNSLYSTEPAQSETVQSAESLKTMIAFQTNEDVKGLGAGCGHRGSPDDTTQCTDSTFLAELRTGIYPKGPSDSLKAKYIEVFAFNVNSTPGDILVAHNELLAPMSTGVQLVDRVVPSQFELHQNYPNPFNPLTVISGQLTAESWIRLVIYDLLGREVAVLANSRYPAGRFSFTFDATGFASGVYFYRLTSGRYEVTRSMILSK